MEIIPAIDLINGQCVRLSAGDFNRQTTYDADPVAVAQRFADAGVRRLHLVDLDGARAGQGQYSFDLTQSPLWTGKIVRVDLLLGFPIGGGADNFTMDLDWVRLHRANAPPAPPASPTVRITSPSDEGGGFSGPIPARFPGADSDRDKMRCSGLKSRRHGL